VRDLLGPMLARAMPITVKTDPRATGRTTSRSSSATPGSGELGWTAQMPLDQAVDDLLAYWRGRS
jgi:hypothetical protein